MNNRIFTESIDPDNVRDSIESMMEKQFDDEYKRVKNDFKNLYSMCNRDFVVGDMESPDEIHDRFSVDVDGKRYFWVEMNYETGRIKIYTQPTVYKNQGDRTKFNLNGVYKDTYNAFMAAQVMFQAMRWFAE